MKIGIIGPSKLREFYLLTQISKIVAKTGCEIVVTPDKGSCSEFFAKEFLKTGGKKVLEIVPLDDKEFGHSSVNVELGEIINCGTWRNQPEKLNEETDILLCLGYSIGGLIEMSYSKWFNQKSVFIVKELISTKLPEEIEKTLDLRYVSLNDLKDVLEAYGKK